uniref:Ig-like domain-containing protein n=1 Tax=Laticauda laticaudata TaxID=8630 RepID=A0A8C5SSN0_LATLA
MSSKSIKYFTTNIPHHVESPSFPLLTIVSKTFFYIHLFSPLFTIFCHPLAFSLNPSFIYHHFLIFSLPFLKVFPLLFDLLSPTVTISPTKMDPASPNTILLCTAMDFYPLESKIQWLKNGQLEEEGVAFGEEFQNGDWTYQLQVTLETQPSGGDVYTCQVGHTTPSPSLKPRSSHSARSKLWTGIMGAIIGVAFLTVGLFSYLKSKKGSTPRLWLFFLTPPLSFVTFHMISAQVTPLLTPFVPPPS